MFLVRSLMLRYQDLTQQVVVPFLSDHLGHGHDLLWWLIAPFCLLAVLFVPKLRKRCKKGHYHE